MIVVVCRHSIDTAVGRAERVGGPLERAARRRTDAIADLCCRFESSRPSFLPVCRVSSLNTTDNNKRKGVTSVIRSKLSLAHRNTLVYLIEFFQVCTAFD